MKIDVCVLTVGRFDMLEQCLDAILEATKITPCNVYVFDNGSPKEKRLATKVFDHPVITQSKRSGTMSGYADGVNTVVRMGRENLVMFISDDVIIRPDAIDVLQKRMYADSAIGLCGMKLLFPQGGHNGPPGTVQHVGHSVNLRGEVIHPFIGWSASNPRCCRSQEVFSVTGAAWMVRRKLFQRVHGMNDIYGAGYYEDVELALNIRSLGAKIFIDTDAIGEHYVGASFETTGVKNPINENRQIFAQRHNKDLYWSDWMMR